jgi:chorismate mutase
MNLPRRSLISYPRPNCLQFTVHGSGFDQSPRPSLCEFAFQLEQKNPALKTGCLLFATAGQLLPTKSRIGSKQNEDFHENNAISLSHYDAVCWTYKCWYQEQLAAYRQQIDSLDQRINELFQQRARVVEEVGNVKREAHLPVTVPSREQQVIEKAQELTLVEPFPTWLVDSGIVGKTRARSI